MARKASGEGKYALIEQAALFAAQDCNPSQDLRGDEEYKRAMVKVLVKRMIHKAIGRAK